MSQCRASGITGLVLTYNGQRLLQQCLESISFCDQLLIVDSCSTDRTREIARLFGAEPRVRVIERPWPGPGAQFAFALEQITTEWVVSLDQDELCSAALRASILSATQGSDAPDGFFVPRCSWYYDRFMRHSGWYPDRLLRCFRVGTMNVHVSGAHYSFHPHGKTGQLQGDILHYPYANFRQHLDKINDYAQKGADDLEAKGRRGGLARAIAHGLGRFARIYLLKQGFLDGRAGFINAIHGAMYAFVKYLRIDEGNWGGPFASQTANTSPDIDQYNTLQNKKSM